MEKKTSKAEHEIRRESRNVQRGNLPEQRKELADALSAEAMDQFAKVTVSVLREAMWEVCTILKHKGSNRTYSIVPKWEKLTWQWPIFINIKKDFTFNIDLNPSKPEDLQKFCYRGLSLTTKDFATEIDNVKAFLLEETPPPATSKIKKNEYNYT